MTDHVVVLLNDVLRGRTGDKVHVNDASNGAIPVEKAPPHKTTAQIYTRRQHWSEGTEGRSQRRSRNARDGRRRLQDDVHGVAVEQENAVGVAIIFKVHEKGVDTVQVGVPFRRTLVTGEQRQHLPVHVQQQWRHVFPEAVDVLRRQQRAPLDKLVAVREAVHRRVPHHLRRCGARHPRTNKHTHTTHNQNTQTNKLTNKQTRTQERGALCQRTAPVDLRTMERPKGLDVVVTV